MNDSLSLSFNTDLSKKVAGGSFVLRRVYSRHYSTGEHEQYSAMFDNKVVRGAEMGSSFPTSRSLRQNL